jgi:hypothetical protein
MGLFDRLRGRHDSEDALAQARAEAGVPPSAPSVNPSSDPAQPAVPAPGDPSLGVPLTQYGTPTDGTVLPAGQGQDVNIPGIGDLGALMGMIQQAAAQGNLHIDTQNLQMGMGGMPGAQGVPGMQGMNMGMPMLDLRQDPSRRQVVFDILKKHGFDPHEGQAIQVTDPQIQAEIMQALQAHAQSQQQQQQPEPPADPGAQPPMPPGMPPPGPSS